MNNALDTAVAACKQRGSSIDGIVNNFGFIPGYLNIDMDAKSSCPLLLQPACFKSLKHFTIIYYFGVLVVLSKGFIVFLVENIFIAKEVNNLGFYIVYRCPPAPESWR